MGRKIPWAPLDATVLREGYLAGRRGLSDDVNPYPVGTREALAWVIGLMDGRTRRLRIVDGGRSAFSGSF
jgi:hypothetical protein